jgi:hypothetical protein
LFLSNNSFVFAEASIVHAYEDLSILEEVLVRLIRCKLHGEIHRAVSFELGIFWSHSERIFDPLSGGFVHDIQQGPVNVY